MFWITWTEKSKNINFKSTILGVGDGEQKLEKEFNTRLLGQNSYYDMDIILNDNKIKCDVKKLDKQNDFNTGREGRDALRPIKILHTTLLYSIGLFGKSNIFTTEEQTKLSLLQNVSPDELSAGTIEKMKDICVMLNLKKKKLNYELPIIPITIFGKTKDISIEMYYNMCKNSNDLEFPNEFEQYKEKINILQLMDHDYINKPDLFEKDLSSLVEKIFTDIKPIFVDEQKGYVLFTNLDRIKFYRITRGNPRFKVIF